MDITRITIDTHSLIWYTDETLKKKLSKQALETIRKSENEGIIYISAISIMEIVDITEKKKVSISLDGLLSLIKSSRNYKIIPIDEELIDIAISLGNFEIHDRLIMATAIMTNSVLVSKDREIRASGMNVIWSANP